MPLLPLQAAAQVFPGGAVVKAASGVVSSVTDSFVDLLRGNAGNRPNALPNGAAVSDKPASSNNKDGQPSPATTVAFPPAPAVNKPGIGNSIDVPALRAQTQKQIEEFSAKFLQLLNEAGIDTTAGVTLQLDQAGQIQVAGIHFDEEKIEQLLASNPELADAFRSLAGNSSLLAAIEESVVFQREYVRNADAAVANAPHLFSTAQRPTFNLLVLPNKSTPSFE